MLCYILVQMFRKSYAFCELYICENLLIVSFGGLSPCSTVYRVLIPYTSCADGFKCRL
jgi:hypothetical protein